MKKILFAVFLVAIVLLSACEIEIIDETGITWKDVAFGAAVREQLHGRDIASITKLDLFDKSITRIDDIKHFTGLKNVNLDFNNITDISPLKTLTDLALIGNQITDISQLVDSLPQLKYLYLNGKNLL